MWFKNLRVYRITKEFDLSTETLEEALAEQDFKPCTNMDFSRYGWVPPLGKYSEQYRHACSGYMMIYTRTQEKILPQGAINEVVEEKVLQYESAQARSIYRKEKQTIKEDVIHSLLPRALTRSFLTYAYFDPKEKLLIIDSASANKNFPRKLSETGLFSSVKDHKPAAGVIPYSVNAQPWADLASQPAADAGLTVTTLLYYGGGLLVLAAYSLFLGLQ